MTPQHGFLAAIGSFGDSVSRTLRGRHWARWVLNIAVFAAVSVSLVGRAQTFRNAVAPVPPAPPVMPQPAKDIQSDAGNIQSIVAANLFGVDPNAARSGPMARTSLNLVVTGLIATGTTSGMAVMSVDGRPETYFITGDEILPGVRLQAVETERVIVSRNGALEAVPLKEFESSGKSALLVASTDTSAMMVPTSPWAGQDGYAQLAANNTVAPDNQAATPSSVAPATPPNQTQQGNNHGSEGTVMKKVGPAGPPVGASAGKNITVPRPRAGAPVPQVPRPAPGAPVPQVPRPAPGSTVSGPPLPSK